MVCKRNLDIEFVDCDTGVVIRQYHFNTCSEDDSSMYVLLNTKKLLSFLSSFIRGCYKNDHLMIKFKYDKDNIF